MSVLDVIRARKSTRKYKEDPIPEEALSRILEAGRLAPSGKNLQPWKFIIVKDQDLKDRLAEASIRQYFMARAPLIIVACAFPDDCYERMGRYMKSWPVDVAIAVEHMMLQAQEEGLGTCWSAVYGIKKPADFQNRVMTILGVPEELQDKYIVVTVTPLGHPAEGGVMKTKRKDIEKIYSLEKFELK